MADYSHPEALVSTEWVAQHSKDANVRVVEVDVDTTEYSKGHVPGTIAWNWTTQLADTVRRDILSKGQFEKLMSESGISNNSTVILYGDNNNWFAAWALWQMKMYGHKDVRIMNGGRKKWLAEGREVSTEVPSLQASQYTATGPDNSLRAFLDQVQAAVQGKTA
ncbi:MAG: sulfurtransferase, partial [Bryobacterales bacterium]|nr:sulfurtransferase [Bryobacterales bacterium]